LSDRFADLFANFGPIRRRRMFGAEGLFRGDVMFGFTQDDAIYLKTDDVSRSAFIAEGCKPFRYKKHDGEEIVMSYYPIPDRLYDEPEEFAEWARRALAIAERSPTAERKRRQTAGRPPSRLSGARR
jgi:DNA transformation protein